MSLMMIKCYSKAAVLLAGAVIISAALSGCRAETDAENSALTSLSTDTSTAQNELLPSTESDTEKTDSETDSTAENGTDTSRPEPDSDYAADSENETDSDTSTPPSDFDGYVVTIDRCDGTPPEKDTYEKGEGIRLPFREPEQAGYYFDGWYEDLNDLEPVYDGTVYDRDVTIYARWTDKNFYLSADDDYVYVKDTDKGEPVRITLSTTLDFENGIEVLYGEKDDLSNSVTLLDNASRENGDDIKGDGVYSGYAYLKEIDTYYYMVAFHDDERSNVVRVQTSVKHDPDEPLPVDVVMDSLRELKSDPGYSSKTPEEKKQAALDILYDYVEEGLIPSKDCISIKDENQIIMFEGTHGGIGGFYYGDKWFSGAPYTKSEPDT